MIRARVGHEDGGPSGEDSVSGSGTWMRENGMVAECDRPPLQGERERAKEVGRETGGGAQPKEEDEEEEEEQEEREEENAPFRPFIIPGERV